MNEYNLYKNTNRSTGCYYLESLLMSLEGLKIIEDIVGTIHIPTSLRKVVALRIRCKSHKKILLMARLLIRWKYSVDIINHFFVEYCK